MGLVEKYVTWCARNGRPAYGRTYLVDEGDQLDLHRLEELCRLFDVELIYV